MINTAKTNSKIKSLNALYKKEVGLLHKGIAKINKPYYKKIMALVKEKKYEEAMYIVNLSPDKLFRMGMGNLVKGESSNFSLKEKIMGDPKFLIKSKIDKKKYDDIQKRWGKFSINYCDFFYNITKKNVEDIRLVMYYVSQAVDDMSLKLCLIYLAKNSSKASFYSLKHD